MKGESLVCLGWSQINKIELRAMEYILIDDNPLSYFKKEILRRSEIESCFSSLFFWGCMWWEVKIVFYGKHFGEHLENVNFYIYADPTIHP